MYNEDLNVSGRNGFRGWFLGQQGIRFINGLSVMSSLFAQKMSALAVELGFLDKFLGPGT